MLIWKLIIRILNSKLLIRIIIWVAFYLCLIINRSINMNQYYYIPIQYLEVDLKLNLTEPVHTRHDSREWQYKKKYFFMSEKNVLVKIFGKKVNSRETNCWYFQLMLNLTQGRVGNSQPMSNLWAIRITTDP